MVTSGRGNLRDAGIAQVLDVGCGVASFSAYLLPLDIQTMSFAPKDGHENQIQFALERGIGAMIAVIAKKQLPFPSHSFEMVHCSRCRVDWHENGKLSCSYVCAVVNSVVYLRFIAKICHFPVLEILYCGNAMNKFGNPMAKTVNI